MKIRKINHTELKEVLDLVWNVFLKYEAPDYEEEGVLEFKRSISDPLFISNLEIYGAFEDDKILGMVATRNMNHIALFFVLENYQGMGIGRKLYDKVCEVNTDNYFTANASPYAKCIYEHLGFECIDEMQQVNGIKFYPMKGYIKERKIKK